jgi:hypothetical protein
VLPALPIILIIKFATVFLHKVIEIWLYKTDFRQNNIIQRVDETNKIFFLKKNGV